MAKSEKEEIIFEFKVEQGDALTEAAELKKLIVQTKDEQKKLNDAFKKGAITMDEYVQEGVRLEANLKRHQSAYNNVQKSVTGVKTQLDKLIDSNKKISKSFEETASQINVAGVNVGSLTSKLASFANPATAAVGIVGALSAVYARSTIGAKDLEFAQNQLNTAITIGSNAFASLVSSAEDGEGIISKFVSGALFYLDPATGALSRLAAENQERLEDLERTEIEIRDKANQRLQENSELLTEIQSEQTKYNDKLFKTDTIISNLYRTQAELKSVLEDELGILNAQLAIDKNNETVQTAILNKKREISNLDRDTEKRVQTIVRLQQNLIEAETKRAKQIRDNLGLANLNQSGTLDTSLGNIAGQTGFKKTQDSDIKDGTLATVDSQKIVSEGIRQATRDIVENNKAQADSYAAKAEMAQKSAAIEVQAQAQIRSGLLAVAQAFGENTAAYKLIASADAVMNTYKGANIALGTYPPPFSYIAAAATIAAGLANVAQINGVNLGGAAAGGGDFLTKGPTMLMVGDNPGGVERVTVEPISGKGQTKVFGSNLMAFGGGGSVTTAGDGGLFVNSSTMETNQNIMMANAMKMMPPPIVDVVEFTKYSDRVRSRKQKVKIGKRPTR